MGHGPIGMKTCLGGGFSLLGPNKLTFGPVDTCVFVCLCSLIAVIAGCYSKYRDCGFDLCFEFVRMCVMTATLQLCVRMCVNSGWGGGWGGVFLSPLGEGFSLLGPNKLTLGPVDLFGPKNVDFHQNGTFVR